MYLSAGFFNLRFATGDPYYSYFLIGVIAPLHFFIWYRSRFHNQFNTMAIIFILMIVVIIIPLNWFFNGGSHGSSLILSFIAITYIHILFQEQPHAKLFFYILLTITPTLLMVTEPMTKQWIYQYPDESARFYDTIFSYILAIWICILILNMISKRYQLEKEKAAEYAQQLKVLAERDSLTQLYNRQAFAKIYTLAQQRHPHLCLAILDIDFFKTFNDQYGHDMGDQILVTYAKALLKLTQDQGQMVSRHGGEEFLVLFHCSIKEALTQLQQLKKQLNCPNTNGQVVTFSAGIIQVNPNESLNEATQRADKELYRAKDAGRNTIKYK